MGKGRKDKVTFTYRTDEEAQQVSDLEAFLFGGGAAKKLLANQPGDDDDNDNQQQQQQQGVSIADLVRQAAEAPSDGDAGSGWDGVGDDDGSLLFVEDRTGSAAAALDGEGDGDGDEAAGLGPGSAALQGGDGDAVPGSAAGSKRQRAPAWTDAADAELSVPVGAVSRLRKLRQFKAQTDMDGAAYTAALRRQHDMLNPRTSWAKQKKAGSAAAAGAGAPPAAGGVGAAVDDAAEPDEDAAALLLSGSGLLLQGGGGAGRLLAPGSIELSRLRDANCSALSDAVVQALQWHPNGQLMLTAGFDKRLRLFQVDGLRNPLVQSLYLADCPIQTAAFAAGGACVVAAGRRPFYYVADLNTGQLDRVVVPPCINLAPSGAPSNAPLPTGVRQRAAAGSKQRKMRAGGGGGGKGRGSKGGIGMKSCESFVASPAAPDSSGGLVAFLGDGGHIGLVSLAGRSSIGSLKMNGSARAAAFSRDGRTLITAGGDGVLYTWDLRSQRCLHQARDEGVVSCTSLALSPDGAYLASGDSTGVVNVYSRPAGLLAPLPLADGDAGGFDAQQQQQQQRPLRSLMNLTTSVDSLAFNHDSQLLMMGSRLKRESLRLVHLPSATVFANWPTTRSPLQYVHCAAFSPHSGFLGVGNAKGRVLLYRLHHFPCV